MKIAVGADHAGYLMKNELVARLRELGHEVEDFGAHSGDSTDYPDYAHAVALHLSSGQAERGILVCSTGTGMSIAANKLHGVRAAVGRSDEEVRLCRNHNNANVLALGANFLDLATAHRWVDIFLSADFEHGRHARRVNKIGELEASVATSSPRSAPIELSKVTLS